MSRQPRPDAALYWRLIRFGFRLLYNEMAFSYDLVSWGVSLGEWRRWQRAALKHLGVEPGARVLELAHGTANLQIDLRTVGLEPVGIDLSRAMGRIACRKLRHYRIVPRLAQARAQALPFPDESFAAVVSTFPTEFIVDSATLAEAYRVLRPGGNLVFVPNGQLTGGGLARQSLELAYRVTGQRGAWPPGIEARFHAVGFTLSRAVEPGRFSIAQVIIAHKAG